GLTKAHHVDARCVATLQNGEIVPLDGTIVYRVCFRPRQTRRRYHDLPRKGVGRVRYQINSELAGFRKGDIVRVKGRWVKQVNSIYSPTATQQGRLAFKRVKGEPAAALPTNCVLPERGRTVVWEPMGAHAPERP